MLSIAPATPTEGSLIRVAFRPPPADERPDSATRAALHRRVDRLARAGRIASEILAAMGDSVVAVRATLFGEPLHFERDSAGLFAAVAGIPIGAPDSVAMTLVIERGTGALDTVSSALRVGRGEYRIERLAVAPTFGQRPNAALAARIARENRQAAEVARGSHDTPRLWTSAFQRPRASRVTSGFGHGREFNGRIQSRHTGLDLAGGMGAPVVASNRGVVALVGQFYYAGNAVYIDHGQGLVTAYFHLSRVEVRKGQTVEAGQRIGAVGNTGRVTGPHLHWVARYGSVSVDPATLLTLAPIAGSAAPRDSAGSTSGSDAPTRQPLPSEVDLVRDEIVALRLPRQRDVGTGLPQERRESFDIIGRDHGIVTSGREEHRDPDEIGGDRRLEGDHCPEEHRAAEHRRMQEVERGGHVGPV